jgi:predicted transcriptional regulator
MGLHILEKNLMEFTCIVHCNKTVVDYVPKFTKSVETKLCLFSNKQYKRKLENIGLQTKKTNLYALVICACCFSVQNTTK